MTLRSCFLPSFDEFHSAVSEEKSKMSQPINGRVAILFFRSFRKHKLSGGRWDLASYQVLLNSVQRFKRSRKFLSQSEAAGAVILGGFFSIGPKNANLVEDVDILLPVKCRSITFSVRLRCTKNETYLWFQFRYLSWKYRFLYLFRKRDIYNRDISIYCENKWRYLLFKIEIFQLNIEISLFL